MLQLTRRYLRQIDGIFLALCAACSVLSVVTLVSIGHNQLGSCLLYTSRQYDRVRRGTMTCLAMTAGTTLCISLALYPSAQLLFRLFSSDEMCIRDRSSCE